MFHRFRGLVFAALGIAAAAFTTTPAHAFKLLGSTWSDGDIRMVLALGNPPGQPLLDGAPDFNTVAETALQDWNTHLSRSRFVAVRNLDAPRGRRNGVNNVFFSLDIYGMSFGENVLAVTLGSSSTTTGRSIEKDVIFNAALTWNSYRGNLRPNLREFRRVALHEFGHVLGLDHPDKDNPPQAVSAVMNSIVSATEILQDDDVAGARALYDPNSGRPPALAAHPQSRTVQVGNPYTMAVTVNSSGPLTYTWSFTPAGSNEPEPLRLASGPSYTLGSVQLADAGTYRCIVAAPGGGFVVSNPATLTVTPVGLSTDTTLANISTRGVVGTDSDVMIAGFVIGGSTPKNVFVRAAGPALGTFGVAGRLADPVLRIVNGSGQTVAENDNWQFQSGTVTAASITAAAERLGAFAFPTGSRDAAVLTQLPPGNYTAIVSGAGNTTGVALVEAYDADPDAPTRRSRKLVNIATRGRVDSGDNVLIAGLVVEGPGPRTYLIRAIGPTLLREPFNLPTAMRDPFLQLYRGETLLRENDDWDNPAAAQPAIRQASQKVGAFPMQEARMNSGLDAAMLITLHPGNYTAKVSGFEASTGIALIEIYEVP